jgi:16S rRNA (cytosine1402-N4)-methyltransferase
MEEIKHKRRVRYSGKYPKKFEEKYKEHNPEIQGYNRACYQ